MGFKQCNKCLEIKPLSVFQKQAQAPDGHKYTCNSCRAAGKRERYASDPAFRERSKEILRKWREANREVHRARSRSWAARNVERVSKNNRNWHVKNRDRHDATEARRRAAYMQATPKWVDLKEISEFYRRTRALGLEVDHIVPLKSPRVCGLHCFANLQALDRRLNCSKGNRHWPDMPD
jgi:hypothetical protein